MICGFDIYCRKDNIDSEPQDLQKCSAAVAKLTKHLHRQPWLNLYFDSWLTTLELFHYLFQNKFVLLERFEQTVSIVVPYQLTKIWKNKEEVNMTMV